MDAVCRDLMGFVLAVALFESSLRAWRVSGSCIFSFDVRLIIFIRASTNSLR